MADDDLLAQLGALAREQEDERDPALARLVSGQASAEERSALEARAKDDPALAADVERHKPVGEDLRKRIVERARFQLKKPEAARAGGRRVVVALTALVAAAAALLVVRRPRIDELPGYALSAAGGIDEQRGEPTRETLELTAGSTLEVLLRPAQDVSGEVELRALVRAESGYAALPVKPEVSPQGAMRVRARVSELLGQRSGQQELLFVTCRPSVCAEALEAVEQGGASSGEGWQSHPLTVNVR